MANSADVLSILEEARGPANEYAAANKTDVLLWSGPMWRGVDESAYETLGQKKQPHALLVLTTGGGDAHVAYRTARHLQRVYDRVHVFVPGWCKSAGTLLAVCGHELTVGDRGELGPVDVQTSRSDDFLKRASGLAETEALATLEEIAWRLFRKLIVETKGLPGGQITFKTAADAASPLVSGLLAPIFAQLDPLKLGENERALRIAVEYAGRLNSHSGNLRSRKTIDRLVSGYPDHGFVIDRKEAKCLFRNVHKPNDLLSSLEVALGELAVAPAEQTVFEFLSEKAASDGEHEVDVPVQDSERPGPGSPQDSAPPDGKTAPKTKKRKRG